ncbi:MULTISPECIES: serine aminopeptidase domain-containing protein [unclassified Undibacterium]|uniref:serine aminopeptidase domain-containing protein n=1 Tax=unclassified Undibacterium TaxID=2630295 RepID=UPI002AC91C27|nr:MULTISPECIES: alpha/beta hydrolase [unclassified Undibacterium]MEB0138979.1 alpha/beta hydrolase [Undibacterium sp. CCC2.1]MEB0171926.1 alpha/beta hydrolase [Undibacterium sp. CCC1.1]MEB0175867.1 alpha/beta hydrolase [Undibacterium sp. CCC3.4]MEB0215067.1 alpha/beta hydrolase [Undibacterium sp. 5I2]WPX45039.1 alpha/beta hydrolase [Undibacterium sp. CCC3.4]
MSSSAKRSQLYPSQDLLSRAQACWFGDPAAALLAWFHPAQRRSAGGTRACGVVLCPPFGHEYLVAYRAYKHLTEQLAQAGFDVLFFDYHNSGDSADLSGERSAQWQADISSAAQHLRTLAGVEQIALFGLRLGALLAASVASEIGAAALLLQAPVVSGRAYCRELQILKSTSSAQHDREHEAESTDEFGGYLLCAASRQRLSTYSLLTMDAPSMPTLILGRDDLAGSEQKLARHWQEQGVDLTLEQSPGYAAMMPADAHESAVPVQLWQNLRDWLSARFTLQHTAATLPHALRRSAVIDASGAAVGEDLVEFAGLVGVVSRAAGHASTALPGTLPAIILTNIGANHRVGNHRLYVQLARQLAVRGFIVLRFDKAGIGYSRATPEGLENQVYADSGDEDMRHAMEFMRSAFRSNSFVLGGLCSGAYFACRAGLSDERVRGLILMNQLVYQRTVGRSERIKSTHFYAAALRDPQTWKRLLCGQVQWRQIVVKLSLRVVRRLHTKAQLLLTKFLHNPRFLGRTAHQLRALEARGSMILMIMDAGDSSVDLMTENFGRHGSLLGDGDGIHIEILKGADHTFTPLWAQRQVLHLICDQLSQRFIAAVVNVDK